VDTPSKSNDSDELKSSRLEIKALKTKLSSVEHELFNARAAMGGAIPSSFPAGGMGLDEWASGLSQPGAVDGSQSKGKGAKRKVKNASVLNPNQPRRRQRGAKIGEL